jgi:prepilin-type processing-associated H-X9-DG protein
MKASLSGKRERGLTRIELIVVIMVIGVFALVFLSVPDRNMKQRAFRIQCVNNLKAMGCAARVWEGDHGDRFPMNVPGTNGGTMEFTTGWDTWRHFQVMPDELCTPKVLICPADSRIAATNFASLRNSNLSYFIGLDVSETDPQTFLSGDRNITNGTLVKNGVLELTPAHPPGWTAEMHKKVGNVLLADGSVQQLSRAALQNAATNTVAVTNRLLIPVIVP